MDIKQALDACAAVTLGKDMTLRDHAQGCYRMRGLSRGQTLHLLIVDEVMKLIKDVCDSGDVRNDVIAWLVVNSMRSEKLQHLALCQQELTTLWRKTAFRALLDSSAPDTAAQGVALVSRFARPITKSREIANVLATHSVLTEEDKLAEAKRKRDLLAETKKKEIFQYCTENKVQLPAPAKEIFQQASRTREGNFPERGVGALLDILASMGHVLVFDEQGKVKVQLFFVAHL